MQNLTADDVQKLAYTSRQLNTLPELPLMLFNCVIICATHQMETVAKSLKQCFDHTECGYWHNQGCSTTSKSFCLLLASSICSDCYTSYMYSMRVTIFFLLPVASMGLAPSVGGLVVAHFSIDGKLKPDHFNFSSSHHNLFLIDGPDSPHTPPQLLMQIIEAFSFSGHTVLDALSNGKLSECTSCRHTCIQLVQVYLFPIASA